MSKLRKILIALLAVCVTVCAGFALAACKDGDDYKNREEEGGVFRGNYVVSVQSRGGLGLNNVKISVQKDGNSVANGITTNGSFDFKLDPDEYDVVVDESSLPTGYSVASNTAKTSAEQGDVKIEADSKVIKSPAPPTTRYKKGDVMYDFSFQDAVTSQTYTLSEELSAPNRKYAVMLNFWGTTCNPCTTEFPAIKRAYESYSEKLEIFALSSFNNDSDADVIKFKSDGGYPFPMAVDYGNIFQYFNVSAYPTTVIIDRYGVVAYISSGSTASESAWKALFNKYTGASYSQSADISGEENDGELVFEGRPESIVSPDAAAIENALAGENTTVENGFFPAEDKLAWPWKVENDGLLSVTNDKAGVSYSVVRFDIRLKPLEGIKFRYKTNTHSAKNVLYLIVDGRILWEKSEDSEDWQTVRLPAAQNSDDLYYSRSSRAVRITLYFEKIDVVDETTTVSVDDFTIYNITDVADITDDFAISVVDGLTPDENGKYGVGSEDANDENALYYYDKDEDLYYTYYTDGSGTKHKTLLVADINQVTAWTDLHYGDYYFGSPEEGSSASYAASLYQFSYWFMSNWEEASKNDNLLTKLNYDEDDNLIFRIWQVQLFSESGYVPVNKRLHDMLIVFTEEAYKQKDELGLTGEWYADQWLELCYYFRHYGDNHASGKPCFETYNPVKGLSYDYAYKITMEGDEFTQEVTVDKAINYFRLDDEREAGGGIKFTFTPDKDGVYLFSSTHENDAKADPRLLIIDLETKNYTRCILVDNDDDPRFDKIHTSGGNVYSYVELKAGHKYGITATIALGILLSPPIAPETYDLHIEYKGAYAEMMRVATTGGGFWTWTEDSNGNPIVGNNGEPIFNYLAVRTTLDDGKYYVRTTDEHGYADIGEKIYIDFANPTYFEYRGVHLSLEQLIEGCDVQVTNSDGSKSTVHVNGIFGNDTEEMRAFCEQAMQTTVTVDGQQITGLLHATERLVNIISAAIHESVETSEWEQFACYKVTYGTK